MKTTIRRGVFETNSSSTHSLQITPCSTDMALSRIYDILFEAYGERFERNDMPDIDDYAYNDIFFINGFELPDSEENSVVTCIIKTPVAKIQFLGMLLYTKYYESKQEYTDAFSKLVLEWLNKERPGQFRRVEFDLRNEMYIEEATINNKKNGLGDDIYDEWTTVDDFIAFCHKVMEPDYLFTYMDAAYSPYNPPVVKVI